MSLVKNHNPSKSFVFDALYPKLYPSSFTSAFLILILIITSSNVFINHYHDEILALSTVLVIAFMVHFRRGVSPLLLGLLLFFALWLMYISWYWSYFNINTMIGFLCRIIIAAGVVSVLGKRFFSSFVDVVYILACISLPFYLIGLVLPSILEGILSLLQAAPNFFIIDQGEYTGWLRANFLVYTFSMERLGQNHGFMWEPTAFAAVLLLTMLLHLTITGFKFDMRFWLLTLTFITTVSTTGFIAMSLVVVYIFLNKESQSKILVMLLAVPFIIIVYNLDFMSGKIQRELDRGGDISEVNMDLTSMGNSRLSSFIWDIKDFTTHPYFGLGIYEETRYKGFQLLGSVNGISDTLSRFGIFGTLLFMLGYYYSFKRFASEYKCRGSWLILALLLVFSWAERLTLLPLFMAFQFYVYMDVDE